MSTKTSKAAKVPEEAQKEVLEKLVNQQSIPKKELLMIGKRNGMRGDPEKLQNSYISAQMQRYLSELRDDEGNRLVMADKDCYVLLDTCNSQKVLEGIHNRLQNQIRGLERTDRKVVDRVDVLKRMIARLMGQDGGE